MTIIKEESPLLSLWKDTIKYKKKLIPFSQLLSTFLSIIKHFNEEQKFTQRNKSKCWDDGEKISKRNIRHGSFLGNNNKSIFLIFSFFLIIDETSFGNIKWINECL